MHARRNVHCSMVDMKNKKIAEFAVQKGTWSMMSRIRNQNLKRSYVIYQLLSGCNDFTSHKELLNLWRIIVELVKMRRESLDIHPKMRRGNTPIRCIFILHMSSEMFDWVCVLIVLTYFHIQDSHIQCGRYSLLFTTFHLFMHVESVHFHVTTNPVATITKS